MTADLWTALFIGILAAFVGYEVISRSRCSYTPR